MKLPRLILLTSGLVILPLILLVILINKSTPDTSTIILFFALIFIISSTLISLIFWVYERIKSRKNTPLAKKFIYSGIFFGTTLTTLGVLKINHLLGPLQIILVAAIVGTVIYLKKVN